MKGKVYYSRTETGWVDKVKVKGRSVIGTVANHPITTSRFKYGDKVHLKEMRDGGYKITSKVGARKRSSSGGFTVGRFRF